MKNKTFLKFFAAALALFIAATFSVACKVKPSDLDTTPEPEQTGHPVETPMPEPEMGAWLYTTDTTFYSDGSFYSRSETEYEYDANGYRIKEVQRLPEIGYNISCWYEYEYDANGNMIKETHSNSDGSIISEYEYDANGNVVKETYFNSDGSIFSEYEYDANGNRLKAMKCNSDGSISRWNEYEYDANGNKIKETEFNPDGSISNWWEDEYEYDANGNLIKWIMNDCEWYLYEYDSITGKMIKRTLMYIEDSIQSTIYDWSEFEYDINGNWIKETHFNSDGSIDYWSEYEYQYCPNAPKTMENDNPKPGRY